MAEIDNNDNVIDSRKVIERITELEQRQEAAGTCGNCDEPISAEGSGYVHAGAEGSQANCDAELAEGYIAEPSDDPLDEDEAEELRVLKLLAEEGERATHGWYQGATLIHDDHFEDYARETAEDTDGIDTSVWPYTCIDWERAAHELQTDYTSIDFDGETYWTR